uniref:Uncharacterized protein n=1 Tax=Candidatus Methanophaga sp. ANME-1 ERB7 TaxID=2759913 RepID=A0A7G9ZAF2_9EURY|nr:hypothetical protein ALKFPMEL_00018 [Methanosarcinales archaeon ANME-1 ERB7]
MNRIFGAWRCFDKNPELATRVLMDQVSAAASHANPVRHVLELEKSGYLEDTWTLAVGTAMLYSIAFSAAYALLYLTYGVFWF